MAFTLIVLPAWLKVRGARAQRRASMSAAAKLVTGANGFLGAAVARALLADGQRVRAFVRGAAIGATSPGSTSRSRKAI